MTNSVYPSNLTQSQLLIWTGQMLNPDTPIYNMVLTFELKGEISVAHFQEAFIKLVEKTDVLRMIVEVINDVPQVETWHCLVSTDQIPFLDFSNKENPKQHYQNWLNDRKKHLFDLSKPMFDAALIKLANQHFIWYINQHHFITDGWSVTLTYKNLNALYQQTLNNELAENEDFPSFQNYVKYEKTATQKFQNVKTLYYDVSTMPEPPKLYGFSGSKTNSNSQRISINLGIERSQKLRELTKEKDIRAWTQDLALFQIFASILFAYLYRVSGQKELAIGTPAHNRPTLEFKNTAGLFMEVFPLISEVEATDSFSDLFQRVRKAAFSFFQNAQAGAATAELSRSFNVILNYINASFSDFNGIPVQSKWVHPEHHDEGHHLRLQIHDFDASGDIQLHFDLNETVFSKEMFDYVPHHFLNLVDGFIEDRFQKIGACDILGEEERKRILVDFHLPPDPLKGERLCKISSDNAENIGSPFRGTGGETLLDAFEKQTLKTPNAPAITFCDKTLTYQQFNEKANQLGHFLQQKGIGKEDVVAICLDRSLEMMIAIYGILKAGAAYLPLGVEYPKERIDFILQDSSAKMLLIQDRFAEIASNRVPVYSLDAENNEFDKFPKTRPNRNSEAHNLAYIIYTSGSTGKPKGVMVEHGGVLTRLNWRQAKYQMQPTDKVLQKTPYTFDVSGWEFYWPLAVGAELVMAEPDGHKDNNYLVQAINKYQITATHFVPSMLSVFLEDSKVSTCTSLKNIYLIGEAVTIALQTRFFEKLNARLHNLYGPTEASIDVTDWECLPNTTDNVVPIGYPGPDVDLLVLNEYLQLMPIGVPGELHIGGVQLARGYANRPELTAEKFIRNPYKKGERLYKTGDLASYRMDGILDFLGRIDFQVKLNGVRIELGELEAIIEQFSTIQQCVTMVYTVNEMQYLTAYFTAGEKVEVNDLKQFLATKLPNYMIPNYFLQLEKFPLNQNEKVDRKALPAPNFLEKIEKRAYIAPTNQIEEMLAELWSDVLQVSPIGIHDNFFEMGGNSLLAIRITSRINETFELEMPINLIFQHFSIAAYSEKIMETINELMEAM